MKKITYLLSVIILLVPLQVNALSALAITSTDEISTKNEQPFWGTLNEMRQINDELTKKEAELKFLQTPNTSLEDKISLKNEEIKILEDSLTDLEAQIIETDPNSEIFTSLEIEKDDLLENIANLYVEVASLQQTQINTESTRIETIAQIESEIFDLETELEKEKTIATEQIYALSKRGVVYLLLLLFILLFGKIAKRAVRKSHVSIAPKRQKVLIKIINWTVTTLIVMMVLTLLFSQLLVLLPVLALVGTGLAFAVRDVILSVLAWFFIGSEKKYRINDLIEINGAKGRVLDIKLIHTTLKETGQKGPTGRIISFPNKKIFEDHLYNFSSMFQFTWVIFDFLLEEGSNVKKVRELMLASINEVVEQDFNEIQKNLPSLINKFGVNEDSTHAQIFTEITEKGIHMKTKFLVKLSNRHCSSSEISEIFLNKIAEEEDIKLRFLQM